MKIQYTIQKVMTIGRLKIKPLINRARNEVSAAPRLQRSRLNC